MPDEANLSEAVDSARWKAEMFGRETIDEIAGAASDWREKNCAGEFRWNDAQDCCGERARS